jgi:glycosyltransferase involved in cell wall biosynthesis
MYGPRAAQVSRSLAALADLGWRTTAICLDPRKYGPHWPDGVDPDTLAGVELVRVPSPEEWLVTRAAFRLAPALRELPDTGRVWTGRAARAACRAAATTEYAGLLTFGQPWSDHLAGLRVRRATKLPWVAHFSDPWVDSPYANAPAWRRSIWRRMEEDVIRDATAVVFVTAEAADLVMKKYPDEWRLKVAVVPHGFDAPGAATPLPPRRPGPMRIVYTGRFYSGVRTPIPLLDAMARLDAREPLAGVVELTFVGPHAGPFVSQAEARGLGSMVRFLPRLPAREASAMTQDADVLLVIDAPFSPNPFLPSKLIDYLPCRKPILGLTPPIGASAGLLRRLQCPVVPPDDVEAIASALSDLLRRWRSGALQLSASFVQVASEYDIRCTALRLNDVLVRAFERPSRSSLPL